MGAKALPPCGVGSNCYFFIDSCCLLAQAHKGETSSACLLLVIIGFLAASSAVGRESLLNTINAWVFIVASFGLAIPLVARRGFWIGVAAPLLAFPCVLFLPWVGFRALVLRNQTANRLLGGLSLGSLIQLIFIASSSISHAQTVSQRSFDVLDLASVTWIVLVKQPVLLITGYLPVFHFEAQAGNHIFLVGSSLLTVALVACSIAWLTCGFKGSASVVNIRLRAVMEGPLEWLPLMISWQVVACLLALHGSYVLMLSGAGMRFSLSSYLVLLAVTALVALERRRIARWFAIIWLIIALVIACRDRWESSSDAKDVDCFLSRPTWISSSSDWLADRSAVIEGASICPRGWLIREGRLKGVQEMREIVQEQWIFRSLGNR